MRTQINVVCVCVKHTVMSKGLSVLITGTEHYGHERFKETGFWLLSTATPDEWDTLVFYLVPATLMNSFKKTVARLLDRSTAKAANLRGVGGGLITFLNLSLK